MARYCGDLFHRRVGFGEPSAFLPCPRETQRGAGDRGRNRGGHEIGIGVWSRSAAWRSPRPRCMRFHCCEIRACTGASLAEISGLEVQDVDLQEMTINIRFNATRRLKNDPSVRTVPVVDKRAIEALRGSGLLAGGLPMLSFRDPGERRTGQCVE